ncbi:ROK family protein [Stanieria cyanosphaera PCC 7437]|uniref:ROK family protein n=1 Tax=Stanieria cyanosphaera (strain ATCC 29371 / PCC 7437) TaxID=111780 RepID=K9XTL2_STAC7|nr:ROK family protein [Stanieria cyanosphaera]AFZ35878.1 ROK family protein [Stanieria cyanosphaera PCC 7437]
MNSNQTEQGIRTLGVDIGGSGVKAIVLDEQGLTITERSRVKTPQPATPEAVLNAIASLASEQGEFERVAVGFPGVVQYGITKTAVNLDPQWENFNLGDALSKLLAKPVKVANDADIQGLGAIKGQGVELVLTLGTGFGSALFIDGKLVPNLEMGHHPFRKGETYEEQLGRAALNKIGVQKWNNRLQRAIANLEHLFNYNTLYLGGGEAKNINFQLPESVVVIPNISGLLGGIKLWQN